MSTATPSAVEPVCVGPTWVRDAKHPSGWLLPRRTLGWHAATWARDWLRHEDDSPWKYTPEQLRHECCRVKYAIFQSCCEKSPHAMLEILAMGVPVFVVDSQRWIGDDSFDRATSAPYFDTELCGDVNVPDKTMVEAFYKFRQAERLVKYNPRSFAERYTIESSTQILIDIVKECHGI